MTLESHRLATCIARCQELNTPILMPMLISDAILCSVVLFRLWEEKQKSRLFVSLDILD